MSDVSSADIMIKILDDDLPKLAKLYEKHTSWAPHVVSLVNMGIKWKKSEKFRHLITFMSPNNSWEQDGSFVVLYTCNCYDLFIFTLDENCHNLYRGLMETKLIDFNRERVIFFAVHEKHAPIVFKFFKHKNLNIQKETTTCLIYAISPENSRNFTIECPNDIYVKKLDPSLAEQINNAWPYRYPNSQYYLSDMIEINGGYGVFLKSNNELIAWILKDCLGHLGMLQTEEKYKKKGYGTLITKVLSKEIGHDLFKIKNSKIKNFQCYFFYNNSNFVHNKLVTLFWFIKSAIICQFVQPFKDLMETNLIDFNRKWLHFFGIHEKHYKVIEKLIKNKNLNVLEEEETITPCFIYGLSPEDAKNLSIECSSYV